MIEHGMEFSLNYTSGSYQSRRFMYFHGNDHVDSGIVRCAVATAVASTSAAPEIYGTLSAASCVNNEQSRLTVCRVVPACQVLRFEVCWEGMITNYKYKYKYFCKCMAPEIRLFYRIENTVQCWSYKMLVVYLQV